MASVPLQKILLIGMMEAFGRSWQCEDRKVITYVQFEYTRGGEGIIHSRGTQLRHEINIKRLHSINLIRIHVFFAILRRKLEITFSSLALTPRKFGWHQLRILFKQDTRQIGKQTQARLPSTYSVPPKPMGRGVSEKVCVF